MPLAEGFSSILLAEFPSTDQLTAPNDEAEHILGGGIQFGGCYPVRWSSLPGPSIRIGFACRFLVTGASWTVRIRIGGLPNSRSTVAGTIVHTFVVPIGDTVVDELTTMVGHPGDFSYVQVTAEANGPGGSILGDGGTIEIIPDVESQAMAVCTQLDMLHNTTFEIVRGQWLVDFDKFSSSQIKLGWAVRTYAAVSEFCTGRIRIGGTFGANDGTVVLSITDNFGAFDGHAASAEDTITKPTGLQYVKASVQSTGGFAAELRGQSLLILEA